MTEPHQYQWPAERFGRLVQAERSDLKYKEEEGHDVKFQEKSRNGKQVEKMSSFKHLVR